MIASKIQYNIVKIIVVLWSFWIFVNYFLHHPSHYYALFEGPYFDSILALIILSGSLFLLNKRRKIKIRGWKIYVFVLLSMMIIFHNFAQEASIYSDNIILDQFYFLIKNVSIHLATFLVFTLCFILGELVIPLKRLLDNQQYRIVSVAIGMAIMTFTLMVFAAFGILNSIFVIPLCLIVILWRYKVFLSFVKDIFWNPVSSKADTNWKFAIVSLILIFISFNLIGSFKIYPIGHDGAALYQNTTKLLVDSQSLITGGQAYNWSLFTCIGPLLFGKMSFSIIISHSIGILCLWAMYHLGRLFLSINGTWLAMAIFYTLPALSFHNFVDAKVDLGFLFICLSILILLFQYGKSVDFKYSNFDNNSKKVFIVLGILLAFAMGVKYLAVLLIVGVLSMLVYQLGGIKVYLGSFLIIVGLLFFGKVYKFGFIDITFFENYLISGSLLVSGIGILFFSYKNLNKSEVIGSIKNISYMLFVFVFCFSPWIVKNTLESGSLNSKTMLYGKAEKDPLKFRYNWLIKNNINLKLRDRDKQAMREQLELKGIVPFENETDLVTQWHSIKSHSLRKERVRSNPHKRKTNKKEEIERYLGYETGLPKYLSLPYDITMNTNIINTRALDIGFLFLLFLPLLFFSLNAKSIFTFKNIVAFVSLFIVSTISWLAVVKNGNNIGIDNYLTNFSGGPNQNLKQLAGVFYAPFLKLQQSVSDIILPIYKLIETFAFPVTLLFLLLICIGFGLLARKNWYYIKQPVKLLIIFVSSFGFLWWILGNGITYYALIVWLLLAYLVIYYFENISVFINNNIQGFFKKWIIGVVGIFLVFNLLVQFTDKTNNWNSLNNIYFMPFIKYSASNVSSKEILEETFKGYEIIASIINKDPEAKVYRIGTFLNYHIDANNTRVYEDNQLGHFAKSIEMLEDPHDFISVLKIKGFEFILFDLKVASIDLTPEKTLTKKANMFVKLLNNKEKIKLLYTDNIVSRRDKVTNEIKNGHGLVGKTIVPGFYALFRIL